MTCRLGRMGNMVAIHDVVGSGVSDTRGRQEQTKTDEKVSHGCKTM